MPELHEWTRHRWQLALFFLCDGEYQKQNKAKNAYARVIKLWTKMADSPERLTKAKR